jgi:hypothetical protein
MSHKIIKATLPALALSATAGVAQADVLDDAINNAKGAEFTTDVRTRTEKVSSQAEADRLNQEEALRVQALAKRVQSQVESAKSSDQSLKQVVTTVLTDQTKVSAESGGQNQTITKENADNQKAYEDAVRATEAKNAQAQATYEAEKARIAQENAKAVADYEAEKAKVSAQNAESRKTYEDALKRIANENQKAKSDYDVAKQKAESDLHTKEWDDAKLIEDAKSAGVTVRPTKVVDKGTVKESDLTALGSEYDKVSAEVRAKLEVAKKELAKADVEFKANNELKQFVADQRAAIKAIIDADNAKAETTHIRTVIKNGPVIENADKLKQEYAKLLANAQDDRVRVYREAYDYYISKGLPKQEASERASQSAAAYFMPISRTIDEYKKSVLMTTGAKVVDVPVDGTLPVLPVGTNIQDENNPNAVAFRKAVDAIENKVHEIWQSNEVVQALREVNNAFGPGVTLSDNYEEDLKKYEAGQESLEKLRMHFRRGSHDTDLIEENNSNIRSEAGAYAVASASNAGRGGNQNAYINENNMEIVKSSDSVQFLKSTHADSGAMFDVRHSVETSKTPVYFPLAEARNPAVMTDTTLVRIPKGQSITVKYTLKNGQAYLKGKQTKNNTVAQFFAEETATQYKKESKKLTDEDIQDVYTIEATITNNGAVHDGDIIVGVRNNTVSPFYIGVSNGSRPSDRMQWKLPEDDPSMAFNYRLDTSFRNQKGQLLTVGVPQAELTETEHLYHGHRMGYSTRLKSSAYYLTGNFIPFDKAEELEMVDNTDIEIQLDSDNPASKLKWKGYDFVIDPVSGYPNFSLPDDWKDKYMWKTLKTGMSDATTFTTLHKTHNKVLLDWGARDDMNNWSTLQETGSFVYHLSQSVSGLVDFDFTIVPRPIKPPTELKMPKLNVDFVREVTLPQPKPSAPVDPATVASIEPVKWVAKYTKPYTEKPPVPKENPVEPPVLPEPKKPEEKPLPTPPKKEELPKRPILKAIASGSNSFVVKSRKATRPSISVERIQYVAEGRVSSADSLVVRTRNDVKRVGSGNSFIIRRL